MSPTVVLVPARDGDSVVGGRERPAQYPRVKECLMSMSMAMHDTVTVVRAGAAAKSHAKVIATVPEQMRSNYEYASYSEILHFDRELNAAGVPLRRWIVGTADAPLGVALCFRPTWSIPKYTFWAQVRMHPAATPAQTIALWYAVTRWATSAGARTIHTMAHDGDVSPLPPHIPYQRIATEQIYAMPLPMAQIDLPPCTDAVTFHTLDTLMHDDADALENACALHAAISLEVPMPDEPIVTLHKFRRLIGESIDPAQYVIGVIDGQYVAESIVYMPVHNPTIAWQHATGVLPAYRGLGIAQHVKYAAIQIAQRRGASEIRTWVESRNTRMLHINQHFGFAALSHQSAISHIYELIIV